MNRRIMLLPETLTHRIAAGEVVERPASIVKELLENALDAGATEVVIELEKGGCGRIRIADNGRGIHAGDVELAFARHATSKITEFDDLYRVRTFGFRGEALASIASISRTELVTRTPEELAGTRIVVEAGKVVEKVETGCPTGTTVTVSSIFDAVPVRKKFLKAEATERAYCLDVITRLALANPEVRIRVFARGRELCHYPGTSLLSERIALVLGNTDAQRLQPIEGGGDRLRITGFASLPDFTLASTRHIHTLVNRRHVKDYLLNHAVMTAYRRVIEPRRYPAVVVYVDLDPADVDVNVHPAKMEVRFRQPRAVYEAVVEALSGMLRGTGTLYSTPLPSGSAEAVRKDGFKEEDYESRVSEALRRYSLAAGSRRLIYRTAGEFSPEIQRNFPHESAGAVKDSSPEFSLFSLTPTLPPKQGRPVFADLTHIGTLWDTYLIFSTADGMLLIDQHAAHERVLFEKIKKAAERKKTSVQTLLLPEVLNLSLPDFERFTTMMPLLEQVGIEAEPFGGDAVVIKALPTLLAHLEPGALVKDLISESSDGGRTLSLQEKSDKIYAFLACRGAIKAGRKLTREEVAQLCRDLDAAPFAGTCPHGRPVYVLYSLKDIERMFRRG